MICISEYLAGLKCFEKPNENSNKCMSDMAKGITSISAKQMKNGLSMEGFFNDFCKYVAYIIHFFLVHFFLMLY